MAALARKRGCVPLAATTRNKLLKALLAKADAGDVAAAEALVRLSLFAKRGFADREAGTGPLAEAA